VEAKKKIPYTLSLIYSKIPPFDGSGMFKKWEFLSKNTQKFNFKNTKI
jgi:hypothetical protein